MTLTKDTNFYWPWPILEGVPLNEQWFRIRTDTELLNPIVQSTYYENTDGIRGHAALAGYEFGSQSFPNQYRIVYIDSSNEFHFQCNHGTLNTPDWHTLFRLDCDGPNQIQFDGNVIFNAGFYPQLQFTVKDGVHSFRDDTLSFNNQHFYLTKDSNGNPTVNSKTDVITFKDGIETIRDDTLNFNRDNFYLTKDSAGNPSVNLILPQFSEGIDGHFVGVPSQDITIVERASHVFFVDSLSGRTSSGSVAVKAQVNAKTIPQLKEAWFYPDPRTYTVPGYRIATGDRLQFYMVSEAAENFSWSMIVRRNLP